MKQLCNTVTAPSWSQSDSAVFSYLERINSWNVNLAENIDTWFNSAPNPTPAKAMLDFEPQQAAVEQRLTMAEFAIKDLIAVPVSDGLGNDYFKRVAKWLQQNPEAYIKITSYTLDEAMSFDNLLTAIDLANDIKQYLVSLGADADSILITTITSLKPDSQVQMITITPSTYLARA